MFLNAIYYRKKTQKASKQTKKQTWKHPKCWQGAKPSFTQRNRWLLKHWGLSTCSIHLQVFFLKALFMYSHICIHTQTRKVTHANLNSGRSQWYGKSKFILLSVLLNFLCDLCFCFYSFLRARATLESCHTDLTRFFMPILFIWIFSMVFQFKPSF